jgi:hypothetical protein
VANASTNVPSAVANDAMVAQSVPSTLSPAPCRLNPASLPCVALHRGRLRHTPLLPALRPFHQLPARQGVPTTF